MADENGTVTYEVATGGSKLKVVTKRARITPARVSIGTRTWDKAGVRITAYHVGMMNMRLLGYQPDGEAYVAVSEPTATASD